jgi:hypothetical protein
LKAGHAGREDWMVDGGPRLWLTTDQTVSESLELLTGTDLK